MSSAILVLILSSIYKQELTKYKLWVHVVYYYLLTFLTNSYIRLWSLMVWRDVGTDWGPFCAYVFKLLFLMYMFLFILCDRKYNMLTPLEKMISYFLFYFLNTFSFELLQYIGNILSSCLETLIFTQMVQWKQYTETVKFQPLLRSFNLTYNILVCRLIWFSVRWWYKYYTEELIC